MTADRPPLPAEITAAIDAYGAFAHSHGRALDAKTRMAALLERDASRACLEALIAGLAAWQPIETAPKDGTPILAFYPMLHGIKHFSVRCWSTGDWASAAEGWVDEWGQIKRVDQPTHWRPLQAPPSTPAKDGSVR